MDKVRKIYRLGRWKNIPGRTYLIEQDRSWSRPNLPTPTQKH